MNEACAVTPEERTSRTQRITTAILIAIIMMAGYLMLTEISIVPAIEGVRLTLPIVFILGLVASISSCMATSGTVFLSTIGRMQSSKIWPAVAFNIGRVGAYAVFGFLLGWVGQKVSVNYQNAVILNITVSAVMIFIALDMLGILSLSTFTSNRRFTQLFWKIEQLLARQPKKTALFIGALTYYLPCGFSQSVQVVALGTADPLQSMMLMGVFALGTVPALMALSFTTIFTNTSWYPWFMKVVAVTIILVSAGYIIHTVQLYADIGRFGGESYTKEEGRVSFEDGHQVVKMDVLSDGYHPNTFQLQKDIPVKWILNGIHVYGCQGFLHVPKLGIAQALEVGDNTFEFTPKETGTIGFSCSTNARQGAFYIL